MENCENQSVIAFDTIYTNNHIQILKVLLPMFDAGSRKNMAVMIKFMELQYTMECVNRQPAALGAASSGMDSRQPDIVEIFEQIKIFCTPTERAMFDQLANMKKSMEMYQDMMEMMQLFGQLSPDGGSSPFGGDLFGAFGAGSGNDGGQQSDGAGSNPDGEASQNTGPFGGANPLDMLKGMLSPEQQAMFEMFQSSMNG